MYVGILKQMNIEFLKGAQLTGTVTAKTNQRDERGEKNTRKKKE